MGWQDTEISLHRSVADPSIWSANLPMTDIQQIIDSAAPLRRAQRWVVEHASNYGGYEDISEPGARLRWVKEGESSDTLVLQIWVRN